MSSTRDAFRKLAEQRIKQNEAIWRALRSIDSRTLPRLVPPPSTQPVAKNRMMADTLYEETKAQIEEMQSKLKDGEQLVAFYVERSGGPVVISDFGYRNPNMMIIWGTDLMSGNDCSIIVHMGSFEIKLEVIKVEPETPPRQIGFVVPTKETDQDDQPP